MLRCHRGSRQTSLMALPGRRHAGRSRASVFPSLQVKKAGREPYVVGLETRTSARQRYPTVASPAGRGSTLLPGRRKSGPP